MNRNGRELVRSIAVYLLAAVAVAACGWNYLTEHSVRFNNTRTGRAFYRLPPLPSLSDPTTGRELAEEQLDDRDDLGVVPEYELDDGEPTDADNIWSDTRSHIESGKVDALRPMLTKYLELTEYSNEEVDQLRQERRNSAFDMLDALTARGRGSSEGTVAVYLRSRLALDSGTLTDEMLSSGAAHKDRNLADNWEYLRAAAALRLERKDEAEKAFDEFARRRAGSEKHEAAMYTLGKLRIETANRLEEECRGGEPEVSEGATTPKPEPSCAAEHFRKARETFTELLGKHPRGRFETDARGWIAHLKLQEGLEAEAVADYYRLLGHKTDRRVRIDAKRSLEFIGHDIDEEVSDTVESLIAREPDAAMAYAYHRIYNHAVDFSYAEFSEWYNYQPWVSWAEAQEEKKRVEQRVEKGTSELRRVARFASEMIDRFPSARVGGGFVVRLAQAQLELQEYGEALKLSKKAIGLGVAGELREQAMWIKGSAEHRTGAASAARVTFTRLVDEFPKSKLAEGARRIIAMAAEDEGDLESALDQYIALRYQYDTAYFVDVLMPTDRLARYVAKREPDRTQDALVYALAVRYTRDRRWDEARETLRRITTVADPFRETAEGQRPIAAKDPDWEWEEMSRIKASWVLQDLKSIDALEDLERKIELAPDDEARAEAMYKLASYYFDADSLLLYNPSAWNGARYPLLSGLSASGGMRQPGESQLIFEHFERHDTLARSLPIYLEIVDRFPKTRAAADAMYSAAVAHERLSNLNPFWRDLYARGLFSGTRKVGYADVRRAFPAYQLPKGTYGWEPSTRTVDGGSAWEPPPKRAPRPTRTQRVTRWAADSIRSRIGEIGAKWDSVNDGFQLHLPRIFAILLGLVGLIAVGYGAVLAHHFGLIGRMRSRPATARSDHQTQSGPAVSARLRSRIDEVIDADE